jgi:hypothetical protein
MIYKDTPENTTNILEDLKHNYNLNITSTTSKAQAIFLDIIINREPNRLTSTIYSKNDYLIAIPSITNLRNKNSQKDIYKAGILRLWRNTSDDSLMKNKMQQIQKHLTENKNMDLWLTATKFLKLSHYNNIHTHHLCKECREKIINKKTTVLKHLTLGNKLLSSAQRITCKDKYVISIKITPPQTTIIITANITLHQLINDATNFTIILPLKQIRCANKQSQKIEFIFNKYRPMLEMNKDFISLEKKVHPPRLHYINTNMTDTYRLKKIVNKKPLTISSFFNKYKKI